MPHKLEILQTGALRVAATPAVAGHRPLGIALAIAACFAFAPRLHAQPSGAQAIHGSATLSQNGSRLTVTTQNGTGTSHSAINWQSFGIPAGSTTWFAQPGSNSTSINRVVGPDPSAIFGTLGSNGRLVLVNPAGITVGAGAVVDTAGFTASTLRMNDADALAGRMSFGGDGMDSAALQVGGKIVARGGDVVLIAPNVGVGYTGVVQATDGSTIVAAGRKVSMTGRGIEGIHLELKAPTDQALNLGVLKGDSVGVFAGQLRHSGLAQAQSAGMQGGKVVLRADGDALVDGKIVASSAQGTGGSVDVFGNRVGVYGSAQVDVSGADGGGQVRIGGDYQGSNAAVPNAARTFVGADVQVNADARESGNGGRIIVWSDEMTRMQGQLSARGGASGGDGGFAEVSGKKGLEFTGRADLRAPMGRPGSLLLDPNDVAIVASSPATDANPPSPTPMPGDWTFSGGGSDNGTSYVTVPDLQTQLALGNVEVRTGGGVSVGPNSGTITVTPGANVAWSSGNQLGLTAHNGISINASLTATASGGSPNGSLSLSTTSGNISQAAGAITVANLVATAPAGSVTLDQAGNNVGTLASRSSGTLTFVNSTPLVVGAVTTLYSSQSGAQSLGDSVFITTTGLNSHLSSTNVISGSTGVNLAATGPSSDVSLGSNVTTATGALAISATRSIGLSSFVQNSGGAVSLTTSGAGGSISSITAGNITALAGAINIAANGANSDVLLNATANAGGGALTVSATRNVTVGSTGAVTLIGREGVDVHAGNTASFPTSGDGIATSGGPVRIRADLGNLTGAVNVTTAGAVSPGPDQHAVTLTSGGNLSFGSIFANGSFAAIAGRVIVTAGGTIAGASIQTQGGNGASTTAGGAVSIASSGGGVGVTTILNQGAFAGSGGAGGPVTITARDSINSSTVNSGGGSFGSTSATGAGGAGGTINITSNQGNITLGTISSMGGQGASGGIGGTINLTASATPSPAPAPGPAPAVGFVNVNGAYVNGGDSFVTAPADAGSLTIVAGTGISSTTLTARGGSTSIGSGAGGVGGKGGIINLRTALGDITGSTIDASGGNANPGLAGGNGGTITLTAETGNISLNCGCAGSIYADGGYGEPGGTGGSVVVNAPLGTVDLVDIRTYGGAGGAVGNGGIGGNGGTIAVNALQISASELDASGGPGGTNSSGIGGKGGDGGLISITSSATSAADKLNLSGITIEAVGGSGGPGTTSGGAGGNGGVVLLSAGFGLSGTSSAVIDVSGGRGGDSNGPAATTNDRGGNGGNAGSIVASLGGVSDWNAYLFAVGGQGGSVEGSGSGIGGNGGGGGAISIVLSAGATLELGGLVMPASGAQGDPTPAPTPPPSSAQSGTAGPFGLVSTSGAATSLITVSGTLLLGGSWINLAPVSVTAAGKVSALGPLTNGPTGSVALQGTDPLALDVADIFNSGKLVKTSGGTQTIPLSQNTGTLSVDTGALAGELVVTGFATNNGTVEIVSPTSTLSIGVPVSGGAGETLTNLGTIKGRGTLHGSLINGGIVAPGMSPGILTIAGDFTQTFGGSLQMEVSGNTPGTGYDQLNVGGATTLGGQLLMSVVGYTVQPTDNFNIITSVGPIAGSFDSASIPPELNGKVKANAAPVPVAAGPAAPAPSTPLPPPPPPAPSPAPTPAPTSAPTPPPPPPAPAPAPTPAPTPAPAPTPPAPQPPPPPPPPAPAPVSGDTIDQVVAILGGTTTRTDILTAITVQNNLVTETLKKENDPRGGGDGAIVITDTACKP